MWSDNDPWSLDLILSQVCQMRYRQIQEMRQLLQIGLAHHDSDDTCEGGEREREKRREADKNQNIIKCKSLHSLHGTIITSAVDSLSTTHSHTHIHSTRWVCAGSLEWVYLARGSTHTPQQCFIHRHTYTHYLFCLSQILSLQNNTTRTHSLLGLLQTTWHW